MPMRSMLIGNLLLLIAVAASTTTTPATATETYVAEIWGQRTNSPATGLATFVLRDDLSAIDFVITYENLSSPEWMSHVHRGSDEVAILLPMGTPKEGSWLSPTAEDIAQLRAEELYVNIHSEYYPTGEVRGTLLRYTLPVKATTWGAIKALYR